jgi:acetyl-CoA carboxylase biotin carboxyl carrier protein
MIDIRKLKELVRLMVSNELTELDLRDSEEQVTLRRPSPLQATGAAAITPSGPATAVTEAPAPSAALTDQTDGMVKIESPMVGTFYAASTPDAAPFVKVGSAVGPDTPVCIIEAMKIFNEIKAECSGVIEKVLIQNGEPVEFGQPLFLVRPG